MGVHPYIVHVAGRNRHRELWISLGYAEKAMDFNGRRDSTNEAEEEGGEEVIVDFSLKQPRECALILRSVGGSAGEIRQASGVPCAPTLPRFPQNGWSTTNGACLPNTRCYQLTGPN